MEDHINNSKFKVMKTIIINASSIDEAIEKQERIVNKYNLLTEMPSKNTGATIEEMILEGKKAVEILPHEEYVIILNVKGLTDPIENHFCKIFLA
jgi:hypothetical protein